MKSKWPIKRLSEVAEIEMGQSPKGSSYNTSGEGVPLINGPVEFGKTPFSRTKKTKFTTEPTKICKVGDLILCVRGSTTGRMNIAGYESCIGRGVASIRSEKYQDWINFFIHTNRETIYRLGSGATFPNVSGAMLAKLEIPIPPEAEQKRLVAIVDEAFEGIDRAIANTQKNLTNARELFESYLNAIFTQKGNGWVDKKLGDICENLDSRRIPITQSKRKSGDVPYYGASGIVDYVADYIFNEDLLLVSEDGANLLARTYPIAFSISGKTWVNNHAHALRFDKICSQHFVEYYLNSISLEPYVSGMAQPKLNQRQLNSIPVPFPPHSQQQQIVEKLDELRLETQRLEAIYRRKLAALNELKQSILQKAFTGELTADTANQATKTAKEVIAA